jgi:ubiquinone/menaquinone biosynthesis C-methylase UbiE
VAVEPPTDDELLTEQIRYYDERAPTYEQLYFRQGRYAVDDPDLNQRWDRETAELERFVQMLGPRDAILEVACGTGLWTRFLAPQAGSIVAMDASAQMLARNRAWVGDPRLRYVRGDVFDWDTSARFDLVFAGFFLSHVPPSRWDALLAKVHRWLVPGGTFAFVDDTWAEGTPSPAERVAGGPDHAHVRHLDDATFAIVKRFYTPQQLEGLLRGCGFEATVASTGSLFLEGIAIPLPVRGS